MRPSLTRRTFRQRRPPSSTERTDPLSTAQVEVVIEGVGNFWDEVSSLVHSDDSAEEGDHFVVETDEALTCAGAFGSCESLETNEP